MFVKVTQAFNEDNKSVLYIESGEIQRFEDNCEYKGQRYSCISFKDRSSLSIKESLAEFLLALDTMDYYIENLLREYKNNEKRV